MEDNTTRDVEQTGGLTPKEYVMNMFPGAKCHNNTDLVPKPKVRLFEIWITDGHAFWCASGALTEEKAWDLAWLRIQDFTLKAFAK